MTHVPCCIGCAVYGHRRGCTCSTPKAAVAREEASQRRIRRRQKRAARCGHFRTYHCRVTDHTGTRIIEYCETCGTAVLPRKVRV